MLKSTASVAVVSMSDFVGVVGNVHEVPLKERAFRRAYGSLFQERPQVELRSDVISSRSMAYKMREHVQDVLKSHIDMTLAGEDYGTLAKKPVVHAVENGFVLAVSFDRDPVDSHSRFGESTTSRNNALHRLLKSVCFAVKHVSSVAEFEAYSAAVKAARTKRGY